MTENNSANPDAPDAPDYDSPWKEAIDAFFQPFMALFFPSVHALIDWSRPYEFLDAELLRFIDWLIRLPRGLELALRQELAELEEQTKMSYVTSWERFAREEGRQEGEAKALLQLMQAKFGQPTAGIAARVQAAQPAQIEVWLTRILSASSPDEVFEPR